MDGGRGDPRGAASGEVGRGGIEGPDCESGEGEVTRRGRGGGGAFEPLGEGEGGTGAGGRRRDGGGELLMERGEAASFE